MINELYSLSSTIESKGIVTKDWYREYKPLPQATKNVPCIRIWLAKDGSVCGLESLDTELVQSLRKFGNNQSAFPAFNIAPLYRIADQKRLDMLEQIENDCSRLDIDEIRSWCVNDNWRGSLSKKINNCIHGAALRLLALIEGQQAKESGSIVQLIHLADSFSDKPGHDFKTGLEKCVFQELQHKEDVRLALTVLFYKGNLAAKYPEKDSGSLSVILDLQDWQQYGYPVASKHTTEQINELLLKSDQSNNTSQTMSDETDAFGTPFINVDDPMPNVRLKGFDVTLRTMFAGQPCQHRYRNIANTSYPIAHENRALIKKSLEWIADGDREGVTWQRIDKDEIVFVYPSRLPEVPLKFASIFGPRQDNGPVQTEARFERIAKEFIKTLKGILSSEMPDYIQVFTIRKIDKARSKVVFTRNCTPEQFIRAAEEWGIGCLNVPETKFAEQTTLFPLQTARIVNNVWKQNGELASSVERMKYYQGLELLLDPPQESLTCNYLHTLLMNSSGLVKYAGNWQHGGAECPKRIIDVEKQKNEVVLLLSLIGLLLYKHSDRKEKYMENMAYLVGQLLKISDELHALYCQAVREGSIPPQLVGGSLFVAASENPTQALAQLAVRMNPYITWAKQYRTKTVADKGKESWRAGWYLGLYEDVANQLYSELTNSIRFDDFEKAQFFIGYLASFPKREKVVANTNVDNRTNDMGGTNDEQ
jgi:hypothetical protein